MPDDVRRFSAVRGQVLINNVVCAELSVGFLPIEEVDAAPSMARVDISPVPRAALFLAGDAFQHHRSR